MSFMRRTKQSQSLHFSTSIQLQEHNNGKIQEEVEVFRKKLEYYKRKALNLTEIQNKIQKEVNKNKQEFEKLKSQNETSIQKRAACNINFLQKQSSHKLSVQNDVLGEIKQLRIEIGKLRAEKKKNKSTLDIQQQKLNQSRYEFDELMEQLQNNQYGSQMAQNHIFELKQQVEQSEMQYNQRINMLQEELRQDRMMKDTSMRMQSKEDHKYVNIDETTGLISSNQYGAVLKNRCQEISAANKYKQELINQYTKNGRVLSDCFEKMKVMSGIFDIEEVAKLYIQSEGQNRQLQNFVYEVEAEIREKREIERQQLKKINKLIQQNEQMKQMKESGNQADQISYLQEKIQEKQESAIQGQENMNKITSCYMNLAKQLVNSKFNVKGENKVFPEDLQLNHTNITFFLSEIDQFVTNVERFLMEKNPQISNKMEIFNLLKSIPLKEDKPKNLNGLNNLIKEKDNIPTEGVDREYLEKVVQATFQQFQQNGQNPQQNQSLQQSELYNQNQQQVEQSQEYQEQM